MLPERVPAVVQIADGYTLAMAEDLHDRITRAGIKRAPSGVIRSGASYMPAAAAASPAAASPAAPAADAAAADGHLCVAFFDDLFDAKSCGLYTQPNLHTGISNPRSTVVIVF